MLSFKEKRELQKIISAQNAILAGNPSFSEKRAAQKAKADALIKLGVVGGGKEAALLNEAVLDRPISLKELENKSTLGVVKANPNATTVIADAIAIALNNTQGVVITGDGMNWTVTKTAFNKMIAATNKDGEKAYQRERIIAIQQLTELAKNATNPIIRRDDGRDEQIESIYEYSTSIEIEGNLFNVRLLCKKWIKPFKNQKDKMHSIAFDDSKGPASPANQEVIADGLLLSLELVLLDGKEGAANAQGLPDLSPSASNDLSIDQSQEKSTDNSQYGLQASGIKTREKINAQVKSITDLIRAGKDPATLTSDEINLLKQYSGKGGLTINSQHEYYTPTHLAQGVWDALKINGFENGNVLEPSSGAGVFLATKPQGVIATGTEIDETSATVAQVLNPNDKVGNSSFELLAVNAADNSFDAVIGNVPFGNARGASAHDDPEYKSEKLIERYFVQRVIDKVKPGGLICLIVPVNIIQAKGKAWEKFRIAISKKAEFLGGHKLPSKTFGKQGTDVVVDVLVMRKHGAEFLSRVDDLPFDTLKATNVVWDEFIEGRYWQGEGKKFIKGEFVPKDPTKFRDSDKVIAGENMTDEALKRSLAVKFDSRIDWELLDEAEPITRNYSEGDIKAINGLDYEFKAGQWQKVTYDTQKTIIDLAQYGADSIEALQGLMSTDAGILSLNWAQVESTLAAYPNIVPGYVKDALRFSDLQPPEHQWRAFRGAIIGAKIEGYLNSGSNDQGELDELKEIILHEVVKYGSPKDITGLVLAGKESKRLGMFINSIDEKGNFSPMLESGILKQEADEYNSADVTSIIAYLFEQNQDPVELSTILDMYDGDKRLEDLGDIVEIPGMAVSPDGFIWPLEQYCSGEIYQKMRDMRDAMLDEKDPRIIAAYKRQIERIDAKRRKTPTEDITFAMRQKWFDKAYVLEFLQANGYKRTITYSEERGEWKAVGVSGGIVPQIVNYLNEKPIAGGTKVAEYKDGIKALEEQFNAFMQSHSDGEDLTDRYNETFNGYVEFNFSNSDLGLKNVSGKVLPHTYQNEAVRRLSREGKGILGFDVGLGKSFSSLALQAYNEQMGRAKRTCITVPDAVLANWYHEHKLFYKDTSNMLFVGMSPKRDKDGNIVQERVLDEKGNPKQDKNGQDLYQDVLVKDDRETIWEKMHRIPQSNLSLVVMTHPQFGKIPVKQATKQQYADEMMAKELLSQADAKKLMEDRLTYEGAKEKDRLSQKYSDEGTAKQDAYPYFEDMGFDSVIVDEAHNFKNSFSPGKESSRIAYLPTPAPSQRAIDMSLKMAHIRKENGGRGPVLLSATPVTNSPLEIYNMLSLLIPAEEFEKFGVFTPDDFIRVFGRVESIEKMKVSGDVGTVDAMVGFQNLDGLRSLFHKYSIIKNAEDVKLPLPNAEEVNATVELSEEQQDIYQILREEAKKASSPDQKIRESARPLFSIIRDMDRTTTDLDMYHKQITFVFTDAHKDAVDKAMAMMPTTVQRKEYDSDLEKDVVVTVPFEYSITESDGKIIVVMTDAGEDDMLSAMQKVGIPEKEVAHPITPKYAELIKNLTIELEAGGKQIIFIEEKTQHQKLARILVHFLPITMENIGVINATDAAGEKLQRISDAYNAGKIKIVIANKKAEVGVNLQKGTTAIHHLTFPWVPASMQQRNGRGVRQGNTVDTVKIYHYIGKGSFDLFRLNLINQKGNWINDILRGTESSVENKGDGHLSAEDVMVLLSDNPEEARARMDEAKAKRDAKKKEKADKAMVINLNQLVEARKKLSLLSGWKNAESLQLTADISAQETKVAGFNDDGSDEAKGKLISLKNKLAATKRKLETLDAKYKEIEENTTATIKQKSVFLRAKAASGELPFDASVIDNTDAVLISREGQIIKAGAIFEVKTLKYVDNKINDLALVTELNNQEKFFIVRARNLTYDIKIYLADLHNYQLQPVAMTKEDWALAVTLAKSLTIKELIELGIDTFTKYRKQIKLAYGNYYISVLNGVYSVLKIYSSYKEAIDDDFVFPDATNADVKRALALYYYQVKSNELVNKLIQPIFGDNWEEIIRNGVNLTPQEEVLSQAALEFSKIAVEYDKSETDLASTISYGSRTGLIERIERTINGDNRENIKQWINGFLNDRKSKALEILADKQRKDEEEKLKSDPNYKEIPEAIADKLKSVGITAKYNVQSVYVGRSHRNAFTMLFLQDSNGKNGLLFKAKEDLKTYFGAQFGTDIGAGLMGAWWFIPADKDITKVVSTITGENPVAELAEQKAKPEKLIVPEGKVKIGDTVAGFVVTSLGKSWEAKDYHISKVKADSGFDIEEGDSIQYARF